MLKKIATKPILRILWPMVLSCLLYVAWAVLSARIDADSWIVLFGLALTAGWIVPSTVLLDRGYRSGTVSRFDSFCFKLVCYTFGVPLIVIWANTMLFYLSQL